MNAFAHSAVSLVLWCVLQVGLFAAATLAVYWLSRRQGANRNALLLSGGLSMVAVLTLASASPWPHWASLFGGLFSSAAASSQLDGVAAIEPSLDRAELLPTAVLASSATELPKLPALVANEQPQSSPAGMSERIRFLPIALTALACGVLFGVVRFARGTQFVWKCRRGSTACGDAAVLDEFQQICSQLRIRRPVELREAPSIAVPATLGCRRPVVLLPTNWRSWMKDERRAVFAHELAHVALSHFPLWVVSQLAIAVHFYQPLVHWLGRRLRFEQELAADELAITAFGSRRGYADVLARLALAPCRPAASRAALGLFMSKPFITRRIAMLRSNSHVDHHRALPTSVAFAALVAAGFIVAGFRATPSARAADETADAYETVSDAREVAVTALLQVPSKTTAPDAHVFSRTQVAILGSRSVLDTAVKRPEVAKLPLLVAQSDPTTWVADRLTVSLVPDSEILHVQMKGPESDREQMRQIVDAIVRTYLDNVNADESGQREIVRAHMEAELAAVAAKLREQQENLEQSADKLRQRDPELEALMREAAELANAKAQLEHKLAKLQSEFVAMEQQMKGPEPAGGEANVAGFQLETVKQQIAQLQASLDGMSPDEARDGERIRKQVQEQLQQLLEQLKSPEKRIQIVTQDQMQLLRKEFQVRAGVLQTEIQNLNRVLQEKKQQLQAGMQGAVDLESQKNHAERLQDLKQEMQIQYQDFKADAAAPSGVRVIQWAM